MSEKFNVIQVGFGPMGQIVAKLLLKRSNINLIGIVDIAENLKGKNIQEILEDKSIPELVISQNLGELLSTGQTDVVIIATSSFFEIIAPMILQAVDAGANVISLCEQLSFPLVFHKELSVKIDKAAKEKNVTVTGSGINPGYLMDLLPIVLTAPCQTVEKIHVTRMMNSSKRRIPFQKKIGTGLTEEEFKRKINEKEITGHVGLEESMQMISAALGMDLEEIIELPPKAMITEREIDGPEGKVPKGYVCGLNSRGVAKKDGKEVIILDFIAYAGDHEEYDSIEITGIPGIKQIIKGGVHGDVGTASMIVNLIPNVYYANAGLLTMKDLPVPCNTANIWKK
ncbi:MAG: dihydrodipicolinate reductase [Candidatus Heimdallarchaeota archaeon]|nr:dihydrodipicolinate reductase [Candidatus Heimdallarchaeota archaeon]